MRKLTNYLVIGIVSVIFSCNESAEENITGGNIYTIEASQYHFVLQKCGYNQDPELNMALDIARELQIKENKEFFASFLESYNEISEGKILSLFFSPFDKHDYPYRLTNEKVIEQLRKEFSLQLDRTIAVLESRLEKFGVQKMEIVKIGDYQIKATVNGKFDKERIQKLIQSSANVGFFETFEGSQANQLLFEIDKAKFEHDLFLMDSTTIFYTDSLYNVAMRTDENILFHWYMPNIAMNEKGYQQYAEGALIGFIKPEDVARLNTYLKDSIVKSNILSNLKLVWGLNLEDTRGEKLEALYAVKANSLYYPVIGSEFITAARTERDENTGQLEVIIQFNQDGAELWSDITARNVGKSIAIMIDDKVATCPIVVSQINGGAAQISGNFTNEAAEDLVHILNSGKMPLQLKIVKTEEIAE